MNWAYLISGLAVLVVSALILWKMIRKNVAKEISYDINQETENDITRLVKEAERIEQDTDDPSNWH